MSTSGLDYNLTTSLIHARTDSVQLDPSLVPLIVEETVTTQYFNVALTTLIFYHSSITMDKEVKYFWCAPRNPISLIYFANRYIGVLGALSFILYDSLTASIASCRFSFWTRGICNWLNIVLIDYILVIRILALYHQEKRLAICLKAILGLEAAIGLGIFIYGYVFEELTAGILAEGKAVCVTLRNTPNSLAVISWVIPLAFGTFLLCLALYKAAEYWRLSSGFKGFHLVRVLILDQVLYYGFIIFTSVLLIVDDAVLLDINPLVANFLAAAASPTLLCIIGGQMLINLKEAGERGANGGTNYRSRSVSDIEFS